MIDKTSVVVSNGALGGNWRMRVYMTTFDINTLNRFASVLLGTP